MQLGGLLGQGAGVAPQNFNGEQAEPEPNASPEEQAEYERVVRNGMELLYTQDGQVLPEVLNRLASADPSTSLSQTAVWLVMMVENSAKQSGVQISDEVLMHAGKELFEQLVEVAETAKIHKFSEKEMQGAWYNALDMWGEANTGGRFDPTVAGQEFLALNEADHEGRADDVLPGFSRLAQQVPGADEEDVAPQQGPVA